MRKPALGGLVLALVLLVAGCGEKKSVITRDSTEPDNDPKTETIDTPDTYMRQLVSATSELADLYESVTDMNSAEKAKPKIQALIRRIKQIDAKGKELKFDALPPQQKEALDKKYKGDQENAYRRAFRATMNHPPAVQKFLKEVEQKAVAK